MCFHLNITLKIRKHCRRWLTLSPLILCICSAYNYHCQLHIPVFTSVISEWSFRRFSYLWDYCAGSWPFLPLECFCPWRSETPFEEFLMKRHLKNQHFLVLQTCYSPDLLLTASIKILSCLSCVRQLRGKEKEAVLKALKIPENSQEILTINQKKREEKVFRQVSGPLT